MNKTQKIMKSKKLIVILALVLSALCQLYGRERTIGSEYRVDISPLGQKDNELKFTLTSQNMAKKLTLSTVPEAYIAGFKSESRGWLIWSKNSAETFNWEVATGDNKSILENLGKKIDTTNKLNVSTSEDFLMLEDVKYVESSGLTLREIDGYKDLYIPNKEKGVFYLGYNTGGKGYILSFNDKGSYIELCEKTDYETFKAWVLKEDKSYPFTETDKYNVQIGKMIYETLQGETPFEGIYEQKMILNNYLEDFSTRNVLGTKFYYETGVYNSSEYREVTEAEGDRIAKEAKKYISLATEYEHPKGVTAVTENKIYRFGSYAAAEAKYGEEITSFKGNPMPYSENGVDTLETFWAKMTEQATVSGFNNTTLPIVKKSWKTQKTEYTDRSYMVGKVEDGTVLLAGCDEIGFLSGVLYKSGLGSSVTWNIGNGIRNPIERMTEYITGYDANKNEIAKEYTKPFRIKITELDYITRIVPYIDTIKKGDLLVYNNEQLGIVTDVTTVVKVVYMNKDKGYAEEVTLKEFAPNIRQLVGRRLLKRGTPQTTNTIASYDVLNQTPFEASISVEIEKKKETSQESIEDYRWIPNTGEYLEIQDIEIKGINNAGLPIGKDGSYIVLKGAKDRGYDKSKTNTGNIYVNEANKFEVVISTQSTELEKGYLSRSSKESSYYTYRSSGTVENELGIGNGNILSYKGETVVIKIRPISPEESYAGDDLLLEFELKNKTGSLCTLECLESDYIAVYDKKMLWRANLYIDETTTTEGNTPKLDWNNAHPWNAPSSKGTIANAPEWWNKDWGYNDWNIPDTNYNGILGGQVVSIPSTKWYYRHDGSGGSQKTVEGTVAYDIQGWDTPFSFKEKLRHQAVLLNHWYTASKVSFNKAIYNWTTGISKDLIIENTGKVVIAETTTEQEAQKKYQNYMSDKSLRWASSETMLGKNSGIFFENDEKGYNNYIFPEKYGTQVSPYVTTSADNVGGGGTTFVPTFIEGVKTVPTTGVVINGETIYPYVPGLSDSLMTTASNYPNKAIGKETAGVDCIGFVQSAHNWHNSPYLAINSAEYKKGPVYWTSSDSDIPTSAMGRFHNNSYSTEIGNYNGITETIDDIQHMFFPYFANVVPGDVVWREGHIMIVSEVKAPSGPDGRYVDRDIVLIESVYSNQDSGYYGVVKRSLKNETTSGKKWALRRQK